MAKPKAVVKAKPGQGGRLAAMVAKLRGEVSEPPDAVPQKKQ